MVITPLIGHRSTARPHGYFNGAGGRSAYLKDAGSASEVIQMKRHGVISTGAQTPDSPVAQAGDYAAFTFQPLLLRHRNGILRTETKEGAKQL
jgi:hypothetical protein